MEGFIMLYRRFGKTNEMVSTLGFGCMRLPILEGGDPSKIDEEKAIKLVRYAIDNGVNYVDTAYPYHGTGMDKAGASEPFVAKALKDGYREKVKLATKLPSWLIKTREDMDKYLNDQLERLNTDTIDFYLVHSLNSAVWNTLKQAGIHEFLDKAIKDGRIKHAGFSFHDKLDMFKEIVDYYDWSFCQIQYNYLDENYQAGTEGLEYAAKKGLGITIMEPLRGGKLVNNIPESAKNTFSGADIKRTPAQWALKWVWNHSEVSVVLSGMNAMEQITENIKTASETEANSLTQKELKIIDEVKTIIKRKTKVNCTGCEYCMPCPSGVNIPMCFTVYNNYHMFGKKEFYDMLKPEQRASNCVECGKCEEHCPQGIQVRQELKNVKLIFE
jgi:predicted aldo/keto reductase-like oxidoreductase